MNIKEKICLVTIVTLSIVCSFCISKNDMVVSPYMVYLNSGDEKVVNYRGHIIKLRYNRNLVHEITIIVDGHVEIFTKTLTDNPRGIYWKKEDLLFSIKPVVWVERNGQKIPIFEKTWNTSEILIEVREI